MGEAALLERVDDLDSDDEVSMTEALPRHDRAIRADVALILASCAAVVDDFVDACDIRI